MKLRVINTINGTSAIEWDSGGCIAIIFWLKELLGQHTDRWYMYVQKGTSIRDLRQFTGKIKMFSD